MFKIICERKYLPIVHIKWKCDWTLLYWWVWYRSIWKHPRPQDERPQKFWLHGKDIVKACYSKAQNKNVRKIAVVHFAFFYYPVLIHHTCRATHKYFISFIFLIQWCILWVDKRKTSSLGGLNIWQPLAFEHHIPKTKMEIFYS